MNALESTVLDTIRRENLIEPADTVLVALSGGADSVAMLRCLLSLSRTLSIDNIRALHVHHGLRGDFADRDEAFVRTLCDELGVPLDVLHVDTKAQAHQYGESVEEAGRRLRYAFFEEQADRFFKAKIVTAHSADDQAETVLFRLIRGSGVKGACGIPYKRGRIVRPLLDCSAKAIRDYCKENAFSYVNDETNTDVCYARNRVRHEILPAMCKINPKVKESIVRFATVLQAEDRFMTSLAFQLLEKAQLDNNRYAVPVLLQADPALLYRAISLIFDYAEHTHIESLCAMLTHGGCVNFPHDQSAVSDGKTLRICQHSRHKESASVSVVVRPHETVRFGEDCYRAMLLTYSEYLEMRKIHKNLVNFCVSYDMIEPDLVLRSRAAGDCLRPVGRNCTKTLKNLFQEIGLPSHEREVVPILSDKTHILAVLGVCVDETVAVTEQTKQVLWLKKL